MTRAPLFRTTVRVRLNAPNSAYHGQTGTVDAHELEQARKRDRTITLQLDDEHITIAFADELEVIAQRGHFDPAAPNGTGGDQNGHHPRSGSKGGQNDSLSPSHSPGQNDQPHVGGQIDPQHPNASLPVDSTPRGAPCDKSQSPTNEVQP